MPTNRKLVCQLLLFCALGYDAATAANGSSDVLLDKASIKNQQGAKNPLIYNRLRHDPNSLQVLRNYQLYKTYEEKRNQVELNETFDDNSSKIVPYEYYQNDAIESSSITQDDLILEALDITYKTRILPVFIHNYDHPGDRQKSSDLSITSTSRCERELNYLIQKLDLIEDAHKNRQAISVSPELAAFFDSFANEEPGVLFGNYHWTGNWRQCNKRLIFDLDRSNVSNTMAFRGRYCTVSIRTSSWDKRIKEKINELIKDNYFKYPEQQYEYGKFFRIQVGLCLPESCDSQLINSSGQINDRLHRLATYKLNEPFRSYDLVDLYCLPDEKSKLRSIELMGWILILVALLWCSCIIMATYSDYKRTNNSKDKTAQNQGNSKKRRSSQKQIDIKTAAAAAAGSSGGIKKEKSNADKLISAFSLIENYHRLTEIESLTDTKLSPRPNDLLFLNAYKVIGMLLMIYGHIGMFAMHLDRFPIDYEILDNNFLLHLFLSSAILVDWYFAITGFLASYIMFSSKKVNRNGWIDWIYSIFHRYWRLAPMLLLLTWFQKYLFQHTGYGPVWDYGTSNMTLRSICREESWFWPITLTTNFHPMRRACVIASWYIASDMQFCIVTVFILIGLVKFPKLTWLTTFGAIVASLMARVRYFLTEPQLKHIELFRPSYELYMRHFWDANPEYTYPHYRIASYLIGLLAGHYAFKVLNGEWSSAFYCQPMVTSMKFAHGNKNSSNKDSLRSDGAAQKSGKLLWLVSFLLMLLLTVCSWPIRELFPRSFDAQARYHAAWIYGFCHSVAGLGMSLMFISLTLGNFPSVRKFLTYPFWTLISRVNFIVYLIQIELIYWIFQSGERVLDLSARESFKYWIQMIFLCYSISIVLTLWVELPLAHLEREYLGNYISNRNKREDKPVQASLSTDSSVKNNKPQRELKNHHLNNGTSR